MIINTPIQAIKNRVLVDKRAVTGASLSEDSVTLIYPVGYTGPTDPMIFIRTSEVPLNLIPVPTPEISIGLTGATGASGMDGCTGGTGSTSFPPGAGGPGGPPGLGATGYGPTGPTGQTGAEYGPYDYIVVTLASDPTVKFEMISSGVASSGKFLVDSDTYRFGFMGFSPDDLGLELNITYYGKGSLIFASDVNELADGSLMRDGAIRPRHIYQGGTGPDGLTGSSDFDFATNVSIGATLNVAGNINVIGDLNISGVVNKSTSEIIDVTDDILLLNSGQTMAGSVGIEVYRGGFSGGTGTTGPDSQLVWSEDPGVTGQTGPAWLIKGTSGVLLSISDNKIVKVCDGGLFKLPLFTADPIPTADMIPATFYNSTDNQIKGIVSDGMMGAKIIILG